MQDNVLIHYGDAVKALGDDGRVGGYLVRFSDASSPDISSMRDFFTAETDYDIVDGERKSVYFAHGLDAKMGVKRIGTGTVKTDDVGVWVEAQLSLRDDYEKAVFSMVKAGKLGWSSGAPSHLVTRKAIGKAHEVLTWNISEASLTPTPAEPRNDCMALKALPSLLGIGPNAATKDDDDGIPTDSRDHHEDGDEGRDDLVSDEQMPDGAVEPTKQADVAAIKASLVQSMTFDDHADIATSALSGFVERAASLTDLAVKSGRAMSASRHAKLKQTVAGMQTAHTAMAGHIATVNEVLDSTDPNKDAKKDADEFATLRAQFLRIQSNQLHATV